jgi:hypothetical protein
MVIVPTVSCAGPMSEVVMNGAPIWGELHNASEINSAPLNYSLKCVQFEIKSIH